MKDNEAVLGFSRSEKILIILVPLLLGGLIGWFIPFIADWLLSMPIIPKEKLVKLIASLNGTWVSIIATIIGMAAGVFFSMIIFAESLEVKVTYEGLQLKLDDKVTSIHKKDISAIYLENKQFIILGMQGNELYREVIESKKDKVREVMNNYRYPWKEKDPFDNEYKRWVAGHPDFSAEINALLNAREQALNEGEKKKAKQLQTDLAKLGVVIRDENNAQYVRLAEGIH